MSNELLPNTLERELLKIVRLLVGSIETLRDARKVVRECLSKNEIGEIRSRLAVLERDLNIALTIQESIEVSDQSGWFRQICEDAAQRTEARPKWRWHPEAARELQKLDAKLAQKASSTKYAFVVADIWEAIQGLRHDQGKRSQKIRRSLQEGTRVLSEVRKEMKKGMALVLGSKYEPVFGEESFPLANRVLCTLRSMNRTNTQEEILGSLQMIHKCLENLACGDQITDEDLVLLEKFFELLTESFVSDITDQYYI